MPSVGCDHEMLVVEDAQGQRSTLRWPEITRIWFRTTSAGPWADDQFIVLNSKEGTRYAISLEWPGAARLVAVASRLNAIAAQAWVVGSWTTDQAIQIWPLDDRPRDDNEDQGTQLGEEVDRILRQIEAEEKDPQPMSPELAKLVAEADKNVARLVRRMSWEPLLKTIGLSLALLLAVFLFVVLPALIQEFLKR